MLEELPKGEQLDRGNVRSVVFDLQVSKNFEAADPAARVQVVLQSPRNYWMVPGQVPLRGHDSWVHHEILTDDPALIRAMPEIYNLWFVLEAKGPVRGSVYLDSVGFMVR